MNLKFYSCKSCKKEYKKDKNKYKVRRKWWQIIAGYCPWCERYFRYKVTTTRRNTAYMDEAFNWITACKECVDEDDSYYAELWKDYYSGCL